ncbi:hypothetical protein Ndes2526B_g08229 [Nannochloris sp. 'desiccata']|nr:hypothetical protein KSW81_001703 [Chlorella desiccata (nom. nud.)]KAH7616132.1 putative TBC1 domain family member 2A [Chlorella desiccata (nom. nud.)]
MQYSSLDDCSDTLRDAYGFSVPPLYQDLHRSFASIWQTEETERGERWNQWLQSFRDLDVEKFSQEDDAQLMELALARYTAGFEGNGNEADANTNTNTISSIDLEEAELLQQLRALVQMGVPINRRAQFWSIFLNIKSKNQPGEYLSLVQAALDRETEFKKAAALASYQTVTTAPIHSNTSYSGSGESNDKEERTTMPAADEKNEDCFCMTPLTASSSSSNDSNSSSTSSSPATPFPSISEDKYSNINTNSIQGHEETYEDWLPQIDKDLHRTFPDHPMMDTPGRAALRRILGAYSIRNPEVGYCQGLNFLAATFMLLFNEEDAFWCLAVVVEDCLPGYFDLKMIAPQVDGQVLAHLLRGSAPRVAQHLDTLQVDIPSATSAWFLVAFLNSLPLETCLRVWDVFFFERSSVVLFRAALALIDIYSQALLETDDSSEAYLLLQALGPMSFDSSRLVDSACIGFGHVNDAALRVLRDKYRPEVLEAMESMFSCDEELQSYFENAMNEAAVANTTLSRSQSFSETLAAAAARSATATLAGGSISDAGSIRSISRGNSIYNTTPLSSAPQSPLSRYSSSKSTLDAAPPPPAAASTSPRQSSSPVKQHSLSFSPLGPQHIPTTSNSNPIRNNFWTPPPSSHMKDLHHHQQQQQLFRTGSPLLLLRRSCSAATLGGAVRRSHSSMHHYVHQRIDLHSLAAFVPDLSHPKIAALYRIAAKPSPRKKTSTAAASAAASHHGRSVIDTTSADPTDISNKDSQDISLQWESALAQLPEEFQAVLRGSYLCNNIGNNNNDSSLFENGATVDIGGLAGLIKALKYGQKANQNAISSQNTVGEEGAEEESTKKKVLRRVTDGGALFGKKEIGLLFARNFDALSKTSPLDTARNTSTSYIPSSPGSNTEKLEQLYRLRDELAAEVAAAGRRQTAAMEASIDAVDTAEALHRQLAKIQAEIDVKMASLHSLFHRISSVDLEIATEEEKEQAEIAALEASKASLEELQDAKQVQCAVVSALMTAVGDVRGNRANGTPPGSPGAKSGILRRYFS